MEKNFKQLKNDVSIALFNLDNAGVEKVDPAIAKMALQNYLGYIKYKLGEKEDKPKDKKNKQQPQKKNVDKAEKK